MLFPHDKRKNDGPAHFLRRRVRIVIILAVVLGLGFAVYRLMHFLLHPHALLVYEKHSGERYAFNLQTGEHFLTNSAEPPYSPRILPDGQWQIAYWRLTDSQSMEYEMPLVLQQVNNPHLFLDTGRLAVYEVSWSSDSQWIVFRSRAANCFSKTLDSPYTDLPATPRPREDFCMKTLSYDDYQASELWLFNVRTAEARAVTSNDVIEYLPLFSPRQPQFIYEQNDDLRLYDVDTQQDKLLFSNGIVSNTNWSPDGQWIAFTVHVSTDASAYTYDLYIIRPDGTGLQCVATDVKDNFHWVP